jgi:hypothetical protein
MMPRHILDPWSRTHIGFGLAHNALIETMGLMDNGNVYKELHCNEFLLLWSTKIITKTKQN